MSQENEKEKAPEWYSIRDAATYLSIGEPTLYRWMRDGKITYRKVGDSTRFLKEDLDSVVQVFHSHKDAKQARKVCPVCNSQDLVEGTYRTTGLNYFQPKESKFWSLRDRNLKSGAMMCADCGAVTLFADLEKLRKIRNKKKEEEES